MTKRTSLPDTIADMEEHLSRLQHFIRMARVAALGAGHDPHVEAEQYCETIFTELVEAEEEFDKIDGAWQKIFELSRPSKQDNPA